MGDDRNSYSKTDKEATFMRMKEDHMKNGQLKPAYNLQIGTENQFVTNYVFYQDRDDTMTFTSFVELHHKQYGSYPREVCADAGYGSEENYQYMENNHIEAYVKYNYFHKEQKRAFKNNPFLQENLHYNSQQDYFVCPMGQHMRLIGKRKNKTKTGYQTTIHLYEAQNCQGCPLRGQCHKAQGSRILSVNHSLRAYKEKAKERLTSEKGLEHRRKRPIEPEAVFGQIKFG
ncbi:hypothetical protein EZS27_032766 [termite gut metagenome]|uniref:Transposase DDE domain-containing protein n=1 Tax=termite gut metagenome TaxID=433724 RepID=A0A5J4Q5U6_9ZZZZ